MRDTEEKREVRSWLRKKKGSSDEEKSKAANKYERKNEATEERR